MCPGEGSALLLVGYFWSISYSLLLLVLSLLISYVLSLRPCFIESPGIVSEGTIVNSFFMLLLLFKQKTVTAIMIRIRETGIRTAIIIVVLVFYDSSTTNYLLAVEVVLSVVVPEFEVLFVVVVLVLVETLVFYEVVFFVGEVGSL